MPPLTSNASQASSGCCLARPRLPRHRQPQKHLSGGTRSGAGVPRWVPPQNHPHRGCSGHRSPPQLHPRRAGGAQLGPAPRAGRASGAAGDVAAGLAPGRPRQNKTRHLCAREAASRRPGGGGARPPPTPRPRRGRGRPQPAFLRRGAPRARPASSPGRPPAEPSEVSLHAAANKARPAPLGVPRFGPPPGTGLRAHRSPGPATAPAAPSPEGCGDEDGQEPPGMSGVTAGRTPLGCPRAPFFSPAFWAREFGGFLQPPPRRPAQLQHSWTEGWTAAEWGLPDGPEAAQPRLQAFSGMGTGRGVSAGGAGRCLPPAHVGGKGYSLTAPALVPMAITRSTGS